MKEIAIRMMAYLDYTDTMSDSENIEYAETKLIKCLEKAGFGHQIFEVEIKEF